MQLSIEVEYWVVDRDGDLTESGALAEFSNQVEEEFVEPLFELKTPPCESIADIRETFAKQLQAVLERADELDKGLVPLGTAVDGDSIDRLPDERARIQRRVVGERFDYAKHCAGTHFHVEKRNVTDQLNALIALDPALALLNSSPYVRGERIAAGARSYAYRKKCYGELPKHGQLWSYVDNVGQWNRRLERRYEEFTDAAVAEGVNEGAVEKHFTPDDTVWTPIRLREEMPTVEWRSPDAALPSQILRLAADVERVMEALHHVDVRVEDGDVGLTDDWLVLPEFDDLCELSEAAMHEGLESERVVDYLERLGFDVDAYDPISPRIDGLDGVGPDEARALRRRYADRLREDVAELAETPSQ